MSGGGERLRLACITGLGSGLLPLVPGTWGSVVAVLLVVPVWYAAAALGAPRWTVDLFLVAGILLASHLAVRWGPWAVARWGRADPKAFTLDEVAGQWVALLLAPVNLDAGLWTLTYIVGGQFVLFRVFDILKPPPARGAEMLPAGWGILVDDLVAGVYANVAGQLLWAVTPLAAAPHQGLLAT